MRLHLFNLLGVVITALIPAIVAGLKTMTVPRPLVPVLPLLLGVLAFTAAGLQQGMIRDGSSLLEFVLNGLASGGIASSARDIWHRAVSTS